MDKVKGIMMIGGISALRMRITNLVTKQGLEIHEARNEYEAIPQLLSLKDEIKLIIVDGDMIGLTSVKKISESARFIPIVFMSSYMGRNHILEAIASGAHDYLLKPFEDSDFEERIQKHVRTYYGNISTEVFMDLKTYLTGEFKKAIKGKYAITCMFITLNADSEKSNKDYKAISSVLYENFRHLFWETDVFILYGNRSFFGVFPFCTPQNARLIEHKIKQQMDLVREIHQDFHQMNMEFDFISYPEDVTHADEVLDALMEKRQ